MLNLYALQLCSCFRVRKKRKKPGTNMREVFQSGSLAAFKIRKAVRFQQEEDQLQRNTTPLHNQCRSQLKCWGGQRGSSRGWGCPGGHCRNRSHKKNDGNAVIFRSRLVPARSCCEASTCSEAHAKRRRCVLIPG